MTEPLTPAVVAEHAVVYLGDCLAVLPAMPPESVHAVVTDPPYGLEFMGKKWDAFVDGKRYQQWCRAWATECLRVLKPGGHLVAFGGARTWHRLVCGIESAGFDVRDSIAWLYSGGFPKSQHVLKPGHEPIVVARKPFTGTLVANAAKHATGGIQVDACRIPTTADTRRNARGGDNGLSGTGTFRIRERTADEKPQPEGRWPTNAVLSHAETCTEVCVEACPVAELDRQGGFGTSRRAFRGIGLTGSPVYGSADTTFDTVRGHDDSGTASRFFPVFKYQAKAPQRERPYVAGVMHPTVKPLELVRWLVRLVTPPGGTVLDPFIGSGTTAQAAQRESLHCIGIEREPSYVPLIEARLGLRENTTRIAHEAQQYEPLTIADVTPPPGGARVIFRNGAPT
jgi:hypothetical protein